MPPQTPESDRLESWKQIGAYLDKSERTVRRWNELEGLPVHKHPHQQKGTVWAYRSEIDGWIASRKISPEPAATEAPRTGRWFYAACVIAAGVALAYSLTRPAPGTVPIEPEFASALAGEEYNPAFSPDGTKFAYFHAPADVLKRGIYIRSLDAELPAPLILRGMSNTFNYNPSWSPDGRTIAFLRRNADEETWLHVISATGGPDRRVVQLAVKGHTFYANHQHLSWTPDSASIVAPMATGAENGVYRIVAASGARRRISVPTERFIVAPLLSRDGRRFVYMTREGPAQAGLEEVFVQNLNNAGDPEGPPLSVYRGQSMASGLAWGPSGKDLIFCNAYSAVFGPFDSRLYRLSAEARRKPELLGPAPCVSVATSNPDSSGRASLIFGSGVSVNSVARLWRGSLKNLEHSELFAPSSRYESLPQFSPNGRSVAFLSNRGGPPEIWVAEHDGSNSRQITGNGVPRSAPQWSPDGTRILFAASPNAPVPGIAVVSITGGIPVRVPIDDEFAANPVWSRDGQSIYYSSEKSLWRAGIDGSGRKLIDASSVHDSVHESIDGQFLFFTRPGGFSELCRIPRDGGGVTVLADDLSSPRIAVTATTVYCIRKKTNSLFALAISGGKGKEIGIFPGYEKINGLRTWLGFTVSPDDSQAVWAIGEGQETDLQIIRGFK